MSPKAVSPTLIHLAAFDRNVSSGRRCGSGGRCDGSSGKRRNRSFGRRSFSRIVRAVESGGPCCESTDPFLVADDKIGLKRGESPFRERAQAKLFGSGGEETRLFNHRKSEGNDGDVS